MKDEYDLKKLKRVKLPVENEATVAELQEKLDNWQIAGDKLAKQVDEAYEKGYRYAIEKLRRDGKGMATPQTWATWLEEQIR